MAEAKAERKTESKTGSKSDNKTTATDQNVLDFISAVENERRRNDGLAVLKLMQEITGLEPKMWGTSIVGFGSYHYTYNSGREGDMPLVGFSPRKQNLVLYGIQNAENFDALLGELGKCTLGKGCVYLTRLDAVNMDTLRVMIRSAFETQRAKETPAQ